MTIFKYMLNAAPDYNQDSAVRLLRNEYFRDYNNLVIQGVAITPKLAREIINAR